MLTSYLENNFSPHKEDIDIDFTHEEETLPSHLRSCPFPHHQMQTGNRIFNLQVNVLKVP